MARSRKKIIEDLRRITTAKPHPNDLWGVIMAAEDSLIAEGQSVHSAAGALTLAFLQEPEPIPDAAFALIISTALDQVLELAISTHFPPGNDDAVEQIFDFGNDGPLSDFAAKIKMAHVLGLYPTAAKQELDLIRHIRNAFAHSWEELDFDDDVVNEACNALRLPDYYKSGGALSTQTINWTAKARFLYSCRALYVYLEWHGGGQPMLYSTHPQRALFQALESET